MGEKQLHTGSLFVCCCFRYTIMILTVMCNGSMYEILLGKNNVQSSQMALRLGCTHDPCCNGCSMYKRIPVCEGIVQRAQRAFRMGCKSPRSAVWNRECHSGIQPQTGLGLVLLAQNASVSFRSLTTEKTHSRL